MVKLMELAKVIRAKNASPFLTIFDIFFVTDDTYKIVEDSGIITRELFAKLYSIPATDVLGIYFVDPAKGIKITIRKPGWSSGDIECTDMYSSQQHAPLLDVEIP